MSLAWIATFRAGPSPVFVTVTLNSTGCPLSTLPTVGLAMMSTFSLGSSTLVRDLQPVSNRTVAAWSKGPVLVGFTRW